MGLPELPFAVGDVIDGKFRVERLLGAGGMGTVLAAVHVDLGLRVAVKVMNAQAAKDKIKVQRFLREGKALLQLKSPHTARVSDVGHLPSGSPYLVMEYLDGRDLSSVIDERGQIDVRDAVDYTLQACEALAEAHRVGIIHRDLKPANLFLAKIPGERERVKLLDFGLAKIEQGNDGSTLTHTNVAFGSPRYISPEQLRGARDADERSDIWSLGITLYEMLAGIGPFQGATVGEICRRIYTEDPEPLRGYAPQVPVALETAVIRCLEKDASKRYQDVLEFARAIAPFAPTNDRLERIARALRGDSGTRPRTRSFAPASEVVPAARPGAAATPSAAPKRARRSRPSWLVLALGSGLVAGALVSVGLFLRSELPEDPRPLPPAVLASPSITSGTATTLVAPSSTNAALVVPEAGIIEPVPPSLGEPAPSSSIPRQRPKSRLPEGRDHP